MNAGGVLCSVLFDSGAAYRDPGPLAYDSPSVVCGLPVFRLCPTRKRATKHFGPNLKIHMNYAVSIRMVEKNPTCRLSAFRIHKMGSPTKEN